MTVCAHCGNPVSQPAGAINRALKLGRRIYCDRACSGLGRRKHKSHDLRRAEKATYDREYRKLNLAKIKENKRAYFKRTYDPVAAAEHRKARMPAHVEYCRRPEYKEWKREYDRKFRARKDFGPFADAALLLNDLEREISARQSRYEIMSTNGTLNKALRRRRDYETLIGR